MTCASCGADACACFEAGKVAGGLQLADNAAAELAHYGRRLVLVARQMLGESGVARRHGAHRAARQLSAWAVEIEAVARLLIQADSVPATPPVTVG